VTEASGARVRYPPLGASAAAELNGLNPLRTMRSGCHSRLSMHGLMSELGECVLVQLYVVAGRNTTRSLDLRHDSNR
jgi:hypothetical protein